MALKAKKRETAGGEGKSNEDRPRKATGAELWAQNMFGVVGFIMGVVGLIVYPLYFGIFAMIFGVLNKKLETVNLWKLDIPLGLFNIGFYILTLYLISTV